MVDDFSQDAVYRKLTNTQTNQYQQPTGLDVYEQDRKAIEQRNQKKKNIDAELDAINNSNQTDIYSFPSHSNITATQFYRQAFDSIQSMLNGSKPLNIKKGVYFVENAYFQNTLNYSDFNKQIKDIASLCKMKVAQQGLNIKDNYIKNLVTAHFMVDTFKIKFSSKEKTFVHNPFQYDFEDYRGEKDWSNMFVSKALATNSGQCHSLPLLYLMVIQELKGDANLAFSPNHSYVKFKDNKGVYYNLELTSGQIISDAAVLNCGYVKSEAIKNKIYMNPLDKKQTIATMLTDLALGYINKFGYDDFVLQCTNSALSYFPNNISALQIESNYFSQLYSSIYNNLGKPTKETFQNDTKANDVLTNRDEAYQKIDDLGYEQMPSEMYQRWLLQLNEAKANTQVNLIQQYIK